MVTRRSVLGMIAASPLLGAWQAPAAPRGARALVIGVDAYEAASPLTRAVADARAVAERLGPIGFEVLELLNPTGAEIAAALSAHVRALPGTSASLVFFAGHGVQIQESNFLLGRDARPDSAETVAEGSFQLSEALQSMAGVAPDHNVLILDACRNDPFRRMPPQTSSSIASTQAPSGFSIIFSAGYGEFALDSLGDDDLSPNSVFTRALLPNLTRDKTVREIVGATRAAVVRNASRISHSQTVSVYSQADDTRTLLGESAVPSTTIPLVARPSDSDSRFLAIAGSPPCISSTVAFFPDLEALSYDARLVGRTFSACGIPGRTIVDASDFELRSAVAELAASPASTVFFYYVGHGGIEKGDGALFLDARTRSWPRLRERAPRLGEIFEELKREGRRVCMFIDAGLGEHQGVAAGDEAMPPGTGMIDLLSNDPAAANDRFGKLALFYAASDEYIFDVVEPLVQGPFALALSNALIRAGRTTDELARHLEEDVFRLTSDGRGSQQTTHWRTSSMAGEHFVVPLDGATDVGEMVEPVVRPRRPRISCVGDPAPSAR